MKIIKEHVHEIWQILNRELGKSYPLPDVLVMMVKENEWTDAYHSSILAEEREQLWVEEEIKKGTITREEYESREIHSTHSKIDNDLGHGGFTFYRQRSAKLLVENLPTHARKRFVIPFLSMCAKHKFVVAINQHAVERSIRRFNKNRVSFRQLTADILTHELIHVYELVRVKVFSEDEFTKLKCLITNELFGFTLKI